MPGRPAPAHTRTHRRPRTPRWIGRTSRRPSAAPPRAPCAPRPPRHGAAPPRPAPGPGPGPAAGGPPATAPRPRTGTASTGRRTAPTTATTGRDGSSTWLRARTAWWCTWSNVGVRAVIMALGVGCRETVAVGRVGYCCSRTVCSFADAARTVACQLRVRTCCVCDSGVGCIWAACRRRTQG